MHRYRKLQTQLNTASDQLKVFRCRETVAP